MIKKPRLKQFRIAGSGPSAGKEGCQSYLLFDRETRDAVLIDPLLPLVEDYREYLSEHGLRPLICIDTATHPDHFSGSRLVRDELGCEIAMSTATRSLRAKRRLQPGELVRFGSFSLSVIPTPGCLEDAICLYGEGLLFSGFTLLIGSTGPLGLPGSSVEELWRSLQELKKLPAETVLLPGHDFNDVLFSTLGHELGRNPGLSAKNPRELSELLEKDAGVLIEPDFEARIRFNREDGAPSSVLQKEQTIARSRAAALQADRTGAINVEKYENKLGHDPATTAYVDVREEAEFAEGHIPKTINIPLSELALHLGELKRYRRVYLSCLSGRRSALATKTLSYLGIPDAVNVTGGYKAWVAAGLPVEK